MLRKFGLLQTALDRVLVHPALYDIESSREGIFYHSFVWLMLSVKVKR